MEYKKIIMLLLLVILMLSASACTNSNNSSETPSSFQVELVEPESPLFSQVINAYQKAVEAMRWFEYFANVDHSSDCIELDNTYYYPFKHDTIKTMDGLRQYLLSLFSDDIVDRLLQMDVYRDIDGKLYGLPIERGSNILAGNEMYQIIRETDNKIIYRVTLEILEDRTLIIGYEIHDMIYENINGKWVFSQFELFR